tara:strand:+ start:404 stop:667 length:264 start_codon:yes stop_codon:yes gene_type:complete
MSNKKLSTLLRNMSESEVKTLHDLLFRRKRDKDGNLIETKPKRKTLPYIPDKNKEPPKKRTLPFIPSKDKVKRRQLMNKGGLNKRRK